MIRLTIILLFTFSNLAAKNIQIKEISIQKGDTIQSEFTFPKNIASKYKAKPTDSEVNGIGQPLSFRPIGTSSDGNLAFLKIGCNGACGCCSQTIFIQNLSTNKIIDKFVILNSEDVNEDLVEKENHYWDKNIKKINLFLKKHKIIQQNISLKEDKNISIQKDVYTHTLDFKVEEVEEGGDWIQNRVKYKVDFTKNRSVLKSIENFEAGYKMKYIASYKSPNTNHLIFLFNVHSKGFESELDENLVIIGLEIGK